MVGDYINKMKTTFDFNFGLNQALKQHGYTKTWKQIEAVDLEWFLLIMLVIRKKLVNN